MDEEADEGGLPKEPAGEYVLRRDLRRADPGSVELLVEGVEKGMALDDCWMSHESS